MADYRKMYLKLFNEITNVIDELQEVQRQTELMYMESSDAEIVLLKPETGEKDSNLE